MSPQSISIQFRDGATNQLTHFAAENSSGLICCFPALGVRASYYRPLAEYLALLGWDVITVDWRGHGHSSVRPSRTVDFGYETLVEDMVEVFEKVSSQFPKQKPFLLGHSLGGQIGSLYASQYPDMIKGMMLVASCMVYHTGWEGNGEWKVHLSTRLFPFLAKVVGHFPGKTVGFGGKEARTTMIDWGNNGRTGMYQLVDSQTDYDADLKKLVLPVIAVSLEGDDFAPQKAVRNLTGKYSPEAAITHRHLLQSETSGKLGHFGWVKQANSVGNTLDKWMRSL